MLTDRLSGGNSRSYNKSNFNTLILKRNYSSTPLTLNKDNFEELDPYFVAGLTE